MGLSTQPVNPNIRMIGTAANGASSMNQSIFITTVPRANDPVRAATGHRPGHVFRTRRRPVASRRRQIAFLLQAQVSPRHSSQFRLASTKSAVPNPVPLRDSSNSTS